MTSLAMTRILMMFGMIMMSRSVMAKTIRVPQDAPTIAAAITAAVDGDRVVIFPGTYREIGLDFQGKAITVSSTAPQDSARVASTIIDGNGSGPIFVFYSYEDSTSVLAGLTLRSGVATTGGAMIFSNGSSPLITYCVLTQNSADQGGAAYCSDYYSPPSPHFDQCTFKANTASYSGGGGAFWGEYGSPVFDDCAFIGNQTDGGDGGGIEYWNGTLMLRRCTFSTNTIDLYGYGDGGGLSTNNSSLIMSDCSFTENRTPSDGGGISVYQTDINLLNCVFADNIAKDENDYGLGGGVSVAYSTGIMTSCLVMGNIAGGDGGGINCWQSPITLMNCDLKYNESDDWGGGMRCYRASPTLKGCVVSSNRAVYKGGGLAFEERSMPVLEDCTISQNVSSGYWPNGGGISCEGASEIQMTRCTVSENASEEGYSGTGNGGGIYCTENSVATITNSTFRGNTAEVSGGGIFGRESATVHLIDSIIEENTSAIFGGGISLVGSTLICEGSIVSTNLANGAGGGVGGGIAIDSTSTLDLKTTRVLNNVASSSGDGYGGGVYLRNSTGTIVNCIVDQNRADYGGGFRLRESTMTIENCTATGNSAPNGAGMLCTDSDPTFLNVILWANTPTAIMVEGTESPTVSYSDVQGGWVGPGNIDADPLFLERQGYPYLLGMTSPCKDVGDPLMRDGGRWPQWYRNTSRADMGAYGGPGNLGWRQ